MFSDTKSEAKTYRFKSCPDYKNKNRNMRKSTLIAAFIGFYLGFTVSIFFKSGFGDWRWWAIVVPSIFLMNWMANVKSDEDNW